MHHEDKAVLDYSAPIVCFGAITPLENYVPVRWYPFVYLLKIAIVTAALTAFREPLADIKPRWRDVVPSLVVGLLVFVSWVGIEEAAAYPHLGSRIGFNPQEIGSPSAYAAFIGLRLAGLVLVVPVMEELFWRSFVLRFATSHDFRRIPVGVFSWTAFAIMVAGSSLTHSEWLAAIVAGAAYGLWVRRTKSLFASVIAHATTNGALGLYVITAHAWRYW